MYNMYLEKYEPDMYAKIERGEKCKPKVSYDFYYRYFQHNFNISFGSPRSDTCQTCDRLQNSIHAEQDRESKVALQVEHKHHILKSEKFYTSLKEKTNLAKTDPLIEVLSFDFQQNLPLPHIPAGDVFYKRQLWLYNFCIHSATSGISTFYMYDEVTSKKGSNEVISFLDHYLNNFLPETVKTIYLFSDNAFAQNKNQTLVKYLYTFTKLNNRGIETIIHQYPEPGHSFLPCDRSFALIEKAKRRKERVHIPDEWKSLVRKTSNKFRVIENVTQNMIMDFTSHFKPYFKTTFTTKEKHKFAISTYRLFQYKRDSIYFECSITTGVPIFSRFYPCKENIQLSLPNSKMIQPYPLPLNEKKAIDVKLLAEKYVPAIDLRYWRMVLRESQGEDLENHENESPNSHEDLAYESDSSFV